MAYGNKYGEYIHLHYDNYLKFGLARKSNKTVDHYASLSKFVEEEKTKVLKSLNNQKVKNELNSMEKTLQQIIKPSEESSQLSAKEIENIKQATVDSLSQIFNNLTANDIDWEHLTIKQSAKNRLVKGVDINKVNTKLKLSTLKSSSLGTTGKMNLTSFIKQVMDLRQIINKIPEDSTLNISKLRKRLLNVINQVNTIKASSGGKRRLSLNNESLIKEFRQIAKDILKTEAVSNFNGKLLEHLVGNVLGNITQVGEENIEKLITGALPTTIAYDNKMFSKNSNISNILGKGYKQVNNSDKTISWVYNTPVPGKLDVYGSINDEKIGFNLKNYDLSSTNPHLQSIHLITGSNILYLMQHEIPFLNHYLNQTVYSTNNKGQYVGPQTSGIQLANHYMKRMLLLMSLSGGGMRTDITSGEKANVFIINNNSKNGGIKLYSTIDLYETIVRYKDLSDQVYVSLDGKQRWDNKWSKSSSQARIDNLLRQVKQKKIDVQIGFATMRKVMNF